MTQQPPGAAGFQSMRLAVIGAGWLGGTVGRNWHRAGHEVFFSTRHPERLKAMAAGLGAHAHVGSVAEAAAFGDVILLATPYVELPAIGRAFPAAFRGKVLLDACNPPPSRTEPLSIEAEKTGVGPMSARLFPGARVVRCFSAVDATDIEASFDRRSGKLGTPITGDEPMPWPSPCSSPSMPAASRSWLEILRLAAASSVGIRASAPTRHCQN